MASELLVHHAGHLRGERRLRMVRLHAAGRADTDLVDHAADVHPDHHLSGGMDEEIQ